MYYRRQTTEKKALKEEQKHSAGLLSERFPQVLTIVIHMTYSHKAVNPIIMKRTMYFYPDNYAYFHMDCMKRSCEDGGYDLLPVISTMARDHKETGKGEMVCDNVEREHASISYEINVKYAMDN